MKQDFHKFKPRIAHTARIVGRRVSIGPFSVVEDDVLLDGGFGDNSQITIGSRCKIKKGAILRAYSGEIRIGNRVAIGEYSILAGHSKLNIGDCTLIAGHCYISAANHMFTTDEIIRFQGETSIGINISSNCWIGGHTTILDGVEIGQGCVVGAGSVVTRSLPGNTICFGNPCKAVRKREPFSIMEDSIK